MSDQSVSRPARRRHRYPSDISDRQWDVVSPFCTQPTATPGRPRSTSLREVVDAINYRWNTGCSWRMLPHDFPPWQTVYWYFRVWQRAGTLRPVRETLQRSRANWPTGPDNPLKSPDTP